MTAWERLVRPSSGTNCSDEKKNAIFIVVQLFSPFLTKQNMFKLWHYSCPRRVLAQKAKTGGGTLEAPAYREENIAVPEKISIFENTARKGLPKSTQRMAESLLGVK